MFESKAAEFSHEVKGWTGVWGQETHQKQGNADQIQMGRQVGEQVLSRQSTQVYQAEPDFKNSWGVLDSRSTHQVSDDRLVLWDDSNTMSGVHHFRASQQGSYSLSLVCHA